jgi:SAM-dependent methyltransferase
MRAPEQGSVVASPSENQLPQLFQRILDARLPEYDPWFYTYCGRLADRRPAANHLRHLADLLRFGGVDPRGARILDGGSGFGLTVVMLASLGAEAHGVEFDEAMVRTARAYRTVLPSAIRERVHMTQGSVMTLPYDDSSFDGMLSIEAISHYRDVHAFLAETRRVLRPGGVLIVSDSNNGLNPLTRRARRQLWDALERGGAIGDENVDGYEEERRRFVAENYPDVPASKMARRTFGMNLDELEHACERYLSDGVMPASTYDGKTVPLNPATDMVMERLFNPYELGRLLRRLGFSTDVRGYWGGAGGRSLVRAANRALMALSPLTIFTARAFVIAARKR